MNKRKVMLVFGTRPEAIKMCPVVKELDLRKNIDMVVCVTGQHKEMLDQVLDYFEIVPKYNLDVMQDAQTLYDVTNKVLNGMKYILESEKPDIVLVHGDTTTSFATALACFYSRVQVGHVEAGLRTHDVYSPYPEEFNRQGISIVSKFNFAPTNRAKNNLLAEKRNENEIYVTGNTAIDALKTTVRSNYTNPLCKWVGKNNRLIVLTAHRRENLGEPLIRIFMAINRITQEFDDIKVVFPVHLNPAVQKTAKKIFKGNDRVLLTEPMDVIDFHNLLAKAYLILTDSGGVQEEAPSLGKPVLVLRDITERPEGVEAGTLKLVGTEEENVYNECKKLLIDKQAYKKMSQAKNPYGDGTASIKIADILCNVLFDENYN